jgi:hypothetical protein
VLQHTIMLTTKHRHPSVGWGQYLYSSQRNSIGPSLRWDDVPSLGITVPKKRELKSSLSIFTTKL